MLPEFATFWEDMVLPKDCGDIWSSDQGVS